ncbi:hypothetical protein BKA56DRAFT_624251 [Ilyonectria sp. MPI-CAGE-AT-0026]|nr:hypothetical protein BKA56DRAFT_624251 [Ilyonectria sp. MPI-CAGE-AT-0026]
MVNRESKPVQEIKKLKCGERITTLRTKLVEGKIAIIATPEVFNDEQLISKLVRLTNIGVPCMMLESTRSQKIALPLKIWMAGGEIARKRWTETADRTAIMLDIRSHATTVVSDQLPRDTTLKRLEKKEQELEFIGHFWTCSLMKTRGIDKGSCRGRLHFCVSRLSLSAQDRSSWHL